MRPTGLVGFLLYTVLATSAADTGLQAYDANTTFPFDGSAGFTAWALECGSSASAVSAINDCADIPRGEILAAERLKRLRKAFEINDFAAIYHAALSLPPYVSAMLPPSVLARLPDQWVAVEGHIEVVAATPTDRYVSNEHDAHLLRTITLTENAVALSSIAAPGSLVEASKVAPAGAHLDIRLLERRRRRRRTDAHFLGHSADNVPLIGLLIDVTMLRNASIESAFSAGAELVLLVSPDGLPFVGAAGYSTQGAASQGAAVISTRSRSHGSYCHPRPVIVSTGFDAGGTAAVLGRDLSASHGGSRRHQGYACVVGGSSGVFASPAEAAAAAGRRYARGLQRRLRMLTAKSAPALPAASLRSEGAAFDNTNNNEESSGISGRSLVLNPSFTTGERSVVVMRLKFVDQTDADAWSADDASVITATIAAEMARASFGAVTLAPTVHPDVINLILLATFRSPSSREIREEASRVASLTASLTLTSFDHVIMLLPRMSWGIWAGISGLGSQLGQYVW